MAAEIIRLNSDSPGVYGIALHGAVPNEPRAARNSAPLDRSGGNGRGCDPDRHNTCLRRAHVGRLEEAPAEFEAA
jgi:hypothetical protein